MKNWKSLWRQTVGIAGGLVLLLGVVVEKVSAAEKNENTAYIVYDPLLKTSTLKTVSVGYAPKGRSYSAAQRRLMAKRAATVTAYRNLLQAAESVQPALARGVAIVEMSGYLQGAQTVETRYDENGRAEVEMILPLGAVAPTLEATQKVFYKTICPVYEVEKGKPISKEEYEKLFSPNNEGGDEL